MGKTITAARFHDIKKALRDMHDGEATVAQVAKTLEVSQTTVRRAKRARSHAHYVALVAADHPRPGRGTYQTEVLGIKPERSTKSKATTTKKGFWKRVLNFFDIAL